MDNLNLKGPTFFIQEGREGGGGGGRCSKSQFPAQFWPKSLFPV